MLKFSVEILFRAFCYLIVTLSSFSVGYIFCCPQLIIENSSFVHLVLLFKLFLSFLAMRYSIIKLIILELSILFFSLIFKSYLTPIIVVLAALITFEKSLYILYKSLDKYILYITRPAGLILSIYLHKLKLLDNACLLLLFSFTKLLLIATAYYIDQFEPIKVKKYDDGFTINRYIITIFVLHIIFDYFNPILKCKLFCNHTSVINLILAKMLICGLLIKLFKNVSRYILLTILVLTTIGYIYGGLILPDEFARNIYLQFLFILIYQISNAAGTSLILRETNFFNLLILNRTAQIVASVSYLFLNNVLLMLIGKF